jgi:predicted phosphodiesterase
MEVVNFPKQKKYEHLIVFSDALMGDLVIKNATDLFSNEETHDYIIHAGDTSYCISRDKVLYTRSKPYD